MSFLNITQLGISQINMWIVYFKNSLYIGLIPYVMDGNKMY